MKKLKIEWQRLVSDGRTCPRCGSTERELEKAVSELEKFMNKVDIEIVFEKKELIKEEFNKNPLQSNMIWLNDRPLEEWVNGETGQSECCDVCGDSDCRTTKVGNKTYETIPADLIIKAGLKAATRLLSVEMGKNCCGDSDQSINNGDSCC